MVAFAQPYPTTEQPAAPASRHRSQRRYLGKRQDLAPLGDAPWTPPVRWGRESIAPEYIAGKLVAHRLELIEAGLRQTAFDKREFASVMLTIAVLRLLIDERRYGATIVTSGHQLVAAFAKVKSNWTMTGDQERDRENHWKAIYENLMVLDALGILEYNQDGAFDEWGSLWLPRRTVIYLKELPALDDEQLERGLVIYRARVKRYPELTRLSSTSILPARYLLGEPLSDSEIRHRGVINSRAAKAARDARDAAQDPSPTLPVDLPESPVVEGFLTDTPLPSGAGTTSQNTRTFHGWDGGQLTEGSSRPLGLTDARARASAASLPNQACLDSSEALRASNSPVPFGPGTAEAAGEGGGGRAGEQDRSGSCAERPQQARTGDGTPVEVPEDAETGISPYMRRLVAWELNGADGAIPPPPAAATTTDKAAYLATRRAHPGQTRHELRTGELRELAERVKAAPLGPRPDWQALRIAWALTRHDQIEVGREKLSLLEAAGVLTQADRDRLHKAIALYDRHSQHRPHGWPAEASAALWHIGDLAHNERLAPFRPTFKPPACRWLADGIRRLHQEARDMAAAHKLTDRGRLERQRRRAIGRIVAGVQREGFTTRRGPSTASTLADLAGVQLNCHANWPTDYDENRARQLLQRDPGHGINGTRDGYATQGQLGPAVDGAAARIRRKNADPVYDRAAFPLWQRFAFTPVKEARDLADGEVFAAWMVGTHWRAVSDEATPERIELASRLGPGTLPQVLGYSGELVDRMLTQLRWADAQAHTPTRAVRFTYRRPGA